MELVTDRLVLREYRPEDLEAAHRFTSDPESVRYVTWGPNTMRDTELFLESWLEEQRASPRTGWTLAVTEQGGETFGSMGLYRHGPHHAEMGFSIRRDMWNHGYGTEAARALLAFGFDEVRLRRIWATCRPENAASRRVLENIGMELEGRLRDHVLIRGTWHDSMLYAAVTPHRD